MAEKDAKKAGDKAAESKTEEKVTDPNEKVASKSKMILIAGIGGVLLLALIIGGFIVFKTMTAASEADYKMAQEDSVNGDSNGAKKDEKSKDNKEEKKVENKDEKKDEKKDEHKDEKKDEHKDEKNPEKSAVKKDDNKGTANFGDTFSIARMDLNLGNPIENRYLRVGVGIEFRGGEEQMNELKKREVQIKDIIITTVTKKTRVQLLTENGKELLRREILNKINEVTDRPVQNVFFTDFLVE